MKYKKLIVAFIAIISLLTLTACSGTNDKKGLYKNNNTNTDSNMEETESESGSNDDMNHSSSGEVPKGLKPTENSTYEVGSKAIIESDHMKGMKGAEATIVGAYSTNAYAVSYTPTTGGEKVSNHKWVIQEEIKNAGSELLKPGTKVILEANHMKGMKGANATIDFGERTTVYMIDYTPTNGGERVTNHKWVTDAELSPLDESQ
ncbi:MAG TPA: YdhK family protein [Pseudogracilibacillus sp.]|nr:YdhK family protein [Pseudogracilibacillus sp.]